MKKHPVAWGRGNDPGFNSYGTGKGKYAVLEKQSMMKPDMSGSHPLPGPPGRYPPARVDVGFMVLEQQAWKGSCCIAWEIQRIPGFFPYSHNIAIFEPRGTPTASAIGSHFTDIRNATGGRPEYSDNDS